MDEKFSEIEETSSTLRNWEANVPILIHLSLWQQTYVLFIMCILIYFYDYVIHHV